VSASAELRVAGVRDTVTVGLRQLAALPASVARRETVIAALAGRDGSGDVPSDDSERDRLRTSLLADAGLRAANETLAEVRRDFGLPLALLLDGRGTVIADGDIGRTPRDALGANLRHRAYFREAMASGSAAQFVVGRISREPGVYFSARVDGADGRPLGVVVLKQDVAVLSRLLGEAIDDDLEFVTDAHGVVMLGNQPGLLVKRLPPPLATASGDPALYQGEPTLLPWQVASHEPDETAVRVNGQTHIVASAPLPNLPFTAWVLAPLAHEAPLTWPVVAAALAAWLAGLVVAGTLWRRIERLEAALVARRALSDLEQAQARFAAVFEHAPSAYLFFERRRGITHCNPATVAMFGAGSEQQLRGLMPWFPWMSPPLQADGRESRERALELLRRHVGSHDRVLSFDWRFQRTDGSTFDAEVNVIVLSWDEGPEFCAVVTDVSARKAAEEAMQEARAAAEAASRTKTAFLANMSHELRTPMNAIIGMTHLALEDALTPRQQRYVEKAHGAARNLLQILDDILDVSKVEAGHLELERIEFAPAAIVDEVADLLALKADEKGLLLRFVTAPGLPGRLVGDPTRLRQVMVNLGSNAIKFTDRGEVTLGVEPAGEDTQGIELHGWVRDTGVGLSADEQSRIFRPFVQADNSTTRRFGGTGLGLAICRQLVEKMGGRLWVESAQGRGSTFHFTARFGRVDAIGVAAATKTAPRLGPAPRRRLEGARLLLVEDHPLNQELARELLQRAGIDVMTVGDGAQALAALERDGPFDGVLMDCQMPVMDGYTATERIRANPAWRDLPVIAMTASALAADRDRAFAAGMNAHIAKPLDVEQMFATLAAWIAPGTRASAPAPAQRGLSALRTIDARDALGRCGGNEALYRRLLRLFAAEQAGFAAALAAARASGDWALAERLAHDLKGLAATLGAHALHGAAASLQSACARHDDAACDAALAPTLAALTEALAEIDALADADAPAEPV
jgi:PAS domain S-box-containing protein